MGFDYTQFYPQNVPRGTDALLIRYKNFVIEAQKTMNLISNASIPHIDQRHFSDSLQLLKFIPEDTNTIYDFGSGAGFPGIIMGVVFPQISITLFESTSKKANFLKLVATELKLENIKIVSDRIEKDYSKLLQPDIITARALAPLDQLLRYSHPYIQEDKILKLIFPKGKRVEEEILDAQKNWNFDYSLEPSLTSEEGKILLINDFSKRTRS